MTLSTRTIRAFRRALAAVVDANVRYNRAVHGTRAVADRGARATADTTR